MYLLKEILISEKECIEINDEKFKKLLVYIKINFIDSDRNMYLTVDPLIEINNIITGSNNITFRKVNVKPYGFNKTYLDLTD